MIARVVPVLAVLVVVSTVLAPQPSSGASIALGSPPSIENSWLRATAWVGSSADKAPELNPSTIPFVDGNSASLGGSHVEATYDFSSTSLDISFSLGLGLDYQPFVTPEGRVYFHVDEPVDYVVEGVLTGADDDGIRLYQNAALYDITTTTTLFQGQQDSRGITAGTLTLGLQEGNYGNILVGSTTGSLLPDHFYFIEYKAVLQDQEASSTSASTGSGYFRLTILPEPSTHLLVLLGLVFASAGSLTRDAPARRALPGPGRDAGRSAR